MYQKYLREEKDRTNKDSNRIVNRIEIRQKDLLEKKCTILIKYLHNSKKNRTFAH